MSAFVCLQNYIGIRGFCDDVTPASELFVNDLPGISLKMIASLANEEQESFSGLWDEIRRRSIAMIEADIVSAMRPYFNHDVLVDNTLSGYYRTDFEDHTEPASNNLKGTGFDIRECRNMELFINSIQIFFATAHSGNIQIFDYNTGAVLDTIAYTADVGFNDIQINKEYAILGQRKRIAILYDGNLSATQSTTRDAACCDSSIAEVKGVQVPVGTAVTKPNLTLDDNTHGMLVNFNIQCSISNFVCSSRELFKMAQWYKYGEQLMSERLISDRLNQYTMVNQDRAEALMNLYTEKYVENMDAVLDGLEPLSDGRCFTCNKRRTQKLDLP